MTIVDQCLSNILQFLNHCFFQPGFLQFFSVVWFLNLDSSEWSTCWRFLDFYNIDTRSIE
jgi:hypothetical protein